MSIIPGYSNGIKPSIASKKDRYHATGINEYYLSLYKSHFMEYRPVYGWIYKKCVENSLYYEEWYETRYKGTDRELLMHLTQEYILGVPWGKVTDFIVFDIDCADMYDPGIGKVHPTYDRVQQVLDVLDNPDYLLVRSSDSSGVHVYIFIDAPLPVLDIKAAIGSAMAAGGITLSDGWIEHSTGKEKNALRLPLGAGSFILDHDTYEPVAHTLSDQLDYLADFVHTHTVPVDQLGWYTSWLYQKDGVGDTFSTGASIGRLSSEACQTLTGHSERPCGSYTSPTAIPPYNTTPLNPPSLSFSSTNNGEPEWFIPVAERALENGIEAKGTRRHIIKALVRYHILKHEKTKKETYRLISNFMEAKHNGNSDDINNGRVSKIDNDIKYYIKIFTRPRADKAVPSLLTDIDIEFLHELDLKFHEKQLVSRFLSCAKYEVNTHGRDDVELSHVWF
ncbi:MAG TPA: hypothetical protein ENH10_07520, partial [Bacteroidetes bacterium]|nr:hypothetical protein [Bacteroidota bacterium]HEX04987.1 hypothetical protein [Bacteroidota bacterium]